MKVTRTYTLREIVMAFLDDIQDEEYDEATYHVDYSEDGTVKTVTYTMKLNKPTDKR